MFKNKIFYTKILTTIVISFFAVILLNNTVFFADSPRIRPDAGSRLIARITRLVTTPVSLVARLINGPTASEELKDLPFQQVAKGVYAKEKGNMSVRLYKVNEVDWVAYTFEFNGVTHTIRYPQGSEPPTRETLEKMYR